MCVNLDFERDSLKPLEMVWNITAELLILENNVFAFSLLENKISPTLWLYAIICGSGEFSELNIYAYLGFEFLGFSIYQIPENNI